MLEPIGFWSYTRQDDALSGGSLGRLRKRLQAELQGRMGRRPVRIFQDVEAIPFGADWQQQIDAGLAAASFFVPIITPGFLQSAGSCYEVTQFRARAAAQGWDGVIFPLYYIDADDLAESPQDDLHDPEVQRFLWQRQMFNFRDLRLRNPDGEEALHRIDTFAEAIYRALRCDGRTAASTGQDVRNTGRAAVAPPAEPQPGGIIGDGSEMVLIPPGEFVMGIPEEETKREDI